MNKKLYKYIIIGNSAGAIGGIEGIREIDKENNIAVFSEENFYAYSKPMITDYIYDETVLDSKKIYYRTEGFYKENNIDLFLGKAINKVDLNNKEIFYNDKNSLRFEKLLIATGGTPIIPSTIKGVKNSSGKNKEGIYTFTTLTDSIEMEKNLEKAKNIIILGGGLIGLKTAHALFEAGKKVTVIELCENCLAPVLDKEAASMVQTLFEKNGIEILTKRTIKEVVGESKVEAVILDNDTKLLADILVIAIGVSPRIELVKNTEIILNRGIVVDKEQKTNLDFVFAAGDVAEGYDFILDKSRLLPIWPNAYYGGRIAGLNMAGQKTKYVWATNMNSFNVFKLSSVSAGLINPEPTKYEVLLFRDAENKIYKKIVLENNVIKGMILINEIENAGIILSLMRNRENVAAFKEKLLLKTFGFVNFPAEIRKKIYEKS